MRLFSWGTCSTEVIYRAVKMSINFLSLPRPRVESIFPPFESELALWVPLTNNCGPAASVLAALRSSRTVSQRKQRVAREAQLTLTASTSHQVCGWGHFGQPSWPSHHVAEQDQQKNAGGSSPACTSTEADQVVAVVLGYWVLE